LQHLDVAVVPVARREGAHVEHAEHLRLEQERHAQQRLQSLLAQDRVVDVRLVHVEDRHRPAIGGHPSGEAPGHGDAHVALDLLLDPLGGGRQQVAAVLLEQKDRGGVRVEQLGHAHEQLLEHLLEGEMGESRVRDALQGMEPLAD
jgi:hypothetical protein